MSETNQPEPVQEPSGPPDVQPPTPDAAPPVNAESAPGATAEAAPAPVNEAPDPAATEAQAAAATVGRGNRPAEARSAVPGRVPAPAAAAVEPAPVSGAYANSALMKTDAVRAGFDEALALDQNGHVSEGSAMNIFMVRDGVLITPPVTDNILEGITRRSIIELAREELGLTVLERSIDRSDVFICDEFFMTGTAAQVTVVTKVDHRSIGSGTMGPITAKLRQVFNDVAHGKYPKYQHWIVPVE